MCVCVFRGKRGFLGRVGAGSDCSKCLWIWVTCILCKQLYIPGRPQFSLQMQTARSYHYTYYTYLLTLLSRGLLSTHNAKARFIPYSLRPTNQPNNTTPYLLYNYFYHFERNTTIYYSRCVGSWHSLCILLLHPKQYKCYICVVHTHNYMTLSSFALY